jgi:hypothetical protein
MKLKEGKGDKNRKNGRKMSILDRVRWVKEYNKV